MDEFNKNRIEETRDVPAFPFAGSRNNLSYKRTWIHRFPGLCSLSLIFCHRLMAYRGYPCICRQPFHHCIPGICPGK